MTENGDSPALVRDQKLTSSGALLPIASALAGAILIFLVIAFFKGWTFNFYANILFGFYALTKRVWISVVLLGVTQTLIMIPFRAVRVMQAHNIEKFQKKLAELRQDDQRIAKVKKSFRQGNLTFLFYIVDFMIQLTLFVSIGRLFLTDFYNIKIDPNTFWNFVPYPDYPLQGLIFKLPYPVITQSKDLGWWVVIIAWVLILMSHLFIYMAKRLKRRFQVDSVPVEANQAAATDSESAAAESKNQATATPAPQAQADQQQKTRQTLSFLGSSTLVLFLLAYIVVRRFPLAWEIRIFSGDVSIPNRTMNILTAVMTFLLVVWFGLQDIIRQSRLARERGIAEEVIDLTQNEMFREKLFNATLIGLGAFLLTNLIPSAFELSIFTFEVISLLSPFTLDRLVLKFKDVGSIATA